MPGSSFSRNKADGQMKCSTFLINGSVAISGYHAVPFSATPENITGTDASTIMALDTKDGFVKMSMETWKRLELFIDILKRVDATLSNIFAVQELLVTWQEKLDEQKVQQTMARTGKGEMACTESSAAGEAAEAGLLSDVREEFSSGESAGPPS
jgi:hypothetical protein